MRIVLVIICIFWLLAAKAQKLLVPYRVGATEWYFVDKYTQKREPEDYSRIHYLRDSFYLVWKNKKAGLIHATGKHLTAVAYTPLADYELALGEIFPLKDSTGRIFFFDKTGQPAFEWKFEKMPYFRTYYNQGLLLTPYGFIDQRGKVVVSYYPHVALGQFSDNGFCEVGIKDSSGKNVLWGLIDKKNKFILPMKYDHLDLEDAHVVVGPDITHDHEAYDLNGKKILKGKYTELEVFPSLGLYSYCKDDDEYIFTLRTIKGDKEITDKQDVFYLIAKDRLYTESNSEGVVIYGPNGREICRFTPQQDARGLDHERILYVGKDSSICVADKNGKFIFSLPKNQWFFPKPYNNGYVVKDGATDMMGAVDAMGKVIIPVQYDFVDSHPDIGLWEAKKNGITCFIDENGIKYIKE